MVVFGVAWSDREKRSSLWARDLGSERAQPARRLRASNSNMIWLHPPTLNSAPAARYAQLQNFWCQILWLKGLILRQVVLTFSYFLISKLPTHFSVYFMDFECEDDFQPMESTSRDSYQRDSGEEDSLDEWSGTDVICCRVCLCVWKDALALFFRKREGLVIR